MSFTMRIFNDTTKYGVCLLFFIGCQLSVISSQQSDLMVCGNLTSRGGTLMSLSSSEISIDFSAKKR